MDRASLLAEIPLFESLADEDLVVLAARLEAVHHPADHVIFREGDAGTTLFIIEEGAVDIELGEGKSKVILASLHRGQYFGELSLLDGLPRSASARVTADATLLGLDRDDLIEHVRRRPEAAIRILAEVGERIRATNELMTRQVSRNVVEEVEEALTLGQRIADRVAVFGGSWGFIGLFALFMAIWMTINGSHLAWDVYPYILLNLMLSTVAALQAPVIMMSQNRQAAKDKALAENNYLVNLKNELGIDAMLRGQRELQQRLGALERQVGRKSDLPARPPVTST